MAYEQTVDIHDYPRMYERAERNVQRSALSDRNKALIFGYCDACLRQNVCGRVRLIRIMGALKLFGELLQKDFDTLTRDDLGSLIAGLLRANPPYSPETIGTYKAILKKFMSWVILPDDFPAKYPPPLLAWITCHVRAKDKRRLQRRELLTPEEAARLISVCTNPRDRAFTSTLWECGARIAEIGNLQIKHVTKHAHGYLLDVNGKTGGRNPLVVSSAPYLSAWLAYHPFANDPEAPLWVHQEHGAAPRYVRYQTLRKLLITLFARAGITKRPNPHGLRHARTTHLLASHLMNESMAKAYLGWAPGSKMIATYAHLTTADANQAILAENQRAAPAPTTTTLLSRACMICGETNPPAARFCTRCSNPLSEAAAHQQHGTEVRTQALVEQLCDILVKQGLLDPALVGIHDAGLGPALAHLAERKSVSAPDATHKPVDTAVVRT